MLRFVVRRLFLSSRSCSGSRSCLLLDQGAARDPATSLLGERATPESIAAINKQSVSTSRCTSSTVATSEASSARLRRLGHARAAGDEEFRERFPATIELALAAMFFSVVFGIPLGFLAAKRYGGFFDHFSLFASLLGISIPIFVLAIILK
jgi:peptide/nickel transport system permease protein